MGLPLRSVSQEELVSVEQETKVPETEEWPKVDHLVGDGDPLGAARGVLLGVISGGVLWGLIFWGISFFIY